MTKAFSLLISATTILLSGCEPGTEEVTPLSKAFTVQRATPTPSTRNWLPQAQPSTLPQPSFMTV